MAAVFPQFASKETLEHFRKDEEDPMEIEPKHNPENAGENLLRKRHLHIIIVEKPAGESITRPISSAN